MEIYQHFRPEEQAFIDQVLQWKETVKFTHQLKLTDFLDPREQYILKSLMGEDNDIHFAFYGGSQDVERKRALLFPDYYVPSLEDYQVCLFEVQYPHRFVTIEHPQVLGSLMSLGLKRSKFGDILMDNHLIQVIIPSEIANFILHNLLSIGRTKVSLSEVPMKDLIHIVNDWKEEVLTVSSMRLDVMISEVYSLSRSKAAPIIKAGTVKVNWKRVEETSFECREGDMISVRGYGRCKILGIDGKTKREKWRITVGKVK